MYILIKIQTLKHRKDVDMDWNKFMSALRESGVSEITLKFDNNEKKFVNYDSTGYKKAKVEVPTEPEVAETRIATPPTERKFRNTLSEDAKLEAFKKAHPNWFTVKQISNATEMDVSYITSLVKQYATPNEKCGRRSFYDVEDLWLKRSIYEDDIIRNDGQRPGPVKFVGDRLSAMLEKK